MNITDIVIGQCYVTNYWILRCDELYYNRPPGQSGVLSGPAIRLLGTSHGVSHLDKMVVKFIKRKATVIEEKCLLLSLIK